MGRRDIARVLEAFDAVVSDLDFADFQDLVRPGDRLRLGLPLLSAEWDPAREIALVRVYAVPAVDRAVTQRRLAVEGLPIAARWIAQARGRPEVWRGMRHELQIDLIGEGLRTTELEGGHHSTMHRA